MKFQAEDADLFLQSKDYIDTAIIPLVGINASHIKQTVSLGEFTMLVAEDLERQLKGRVFLFPPYTYLEVNNRKQEDILALKQSLQEHFQHVVFITSDNKWKEQLEVSESAFILQSVPLEHLKINLKQKVIQDSVEQILNFLLQKWNPS
ncbi:YpiF family protein [Bacillus altitudinis]|uniref:YpiF family protein n=1 Tax=Bacillus altitudinis TaxID=293387 RepID=UPI00203B5B43|nr:YpiF family protein [Bacillus altitudinis]MCM3062716.1 YpiF family protein [Bacillus altitudinis]MCM3075420.1 YpiF family protein [Bacillus altitudinis]MCY7630180.1 YpiF family protein [Bacillus altitudinis]MDH3109586.1 YpiF family protein [Bacillus altitudinis]MDX2365407.1 YpiF family protein [Bacillus altitudinis]